MQLTRSYCPFAPIASPLTAPKFLRSARSGLPYCERVWFTRMKLFNSQSWEHLNCNKHMKYTRSAALSEHQLLKMLYNFNMECWKNWGYGYISQTRHPTHFIFMFLPYLFIAVKHIDRIPLLSITVMSWFIGLFSHTIGKGRSRQFYRDLKSIAYSKQSLAILH